MKDYNPKPLTAELPTTDSREASLFDESEANGGRASGDTTDESDVFAIAAEEAEE